MNTVDITAAVEAAARAQYERAAGADPLRPSWTDCAEHERAVYRTAVRPHVAAAAPFVAARSLQDAATAFLATRPADGVLRSLEYPAVELRAMAHRHTAGLRPDPVTSAGHAAGHEVARTAGSAAGQATEHAAGSAAPRRDVVRPAAAAVRRAGTALAGRLRGLGAGA
ncbi:hypothetical protein ACH9EU_13275 [Kocuria sp. M1R5S2]|uniref:hypothetical protein n=1 Tax=Kocuria rhizosphaerae TaxID=3376285 RepID=UPI0037AC8FFA